MGTRTIIALISIVIITIATIANARAAYLTQRRYHRVMVSHRDSRAFFDAAARQLMTAVWLYILSVALLTYVRLTR